MVTKVFSSVNLLYFTLYIETMNMWF